MEAYIRQGDLDLSSVFKIQRTFGMGETLVFSLEGMGATIFCSFLLLNLLLGMVLGLAVTIAGVILLFVHLGHPAKAWRAFTCVGTSWISRGTICMTAFLLIAFLHLGLRSLAGLEAGGVWDVLMKLILLASGLMILIYPGVALAYSPSIPFWNNGFLPISFVLSGMTSGFSWVLLYMALKGGLSAGSYGLYLVWVQTALLGLLFVSVIVYFVVMQNSVAAAKESTQHLMKGEGLVQFGLLGCVTGTALPIILTALIGGYGVIPVMLALISAIARTGGDIYLRYGFVKVGMYDPLY